MRMNKNYNSSLLYFYSYRFPTNCKFKNIDFTKRAFNILCEFHLGLNLSITKKTLKKHFKPKK